MALWRKSGEGEVQHYECLNRVAYEEHRQAGVVLLSIACDYPINSSHFLVSWDRMENSRSVEDG